MKVTCCSRPLDGTSDETNNKARKDYDSLSSVGVEVYLPKTITTATSDDEETNNDTNDAETVTVVRAKDVARRITSAAFSSVLSVNEILVAVVLDARGRPTRVACRVDALRTDDDDDDDTVPLSPEDPWRGRVVANTDVVVHPPSRDDLVVEGARASPPGGLPEDVVHVTTSDLEWFPVRRALLAPCLKLTRFVQAGRGKYADHDDHDDRSSRSPDAPSDDGRPHCRVPIDCVIFDRVLLFLLADARPDTYSFDHHLLGPASSSEDANALADAARDLGLVALADACRAVTENFTSRVRRDAFFSFEEVRRRNATGRETLILLDGMVLDITRWLDEHPGGASIIPTQGLNVDCTVFFEMYHVSRQSFLYLKSFYVGELAPEDRAALKTSASDGGAPEASEGFLRSLRSYTSPWRVRIDESAVAKKVHKSL